MIVEFTNDNCGGEPDFVGKMRYVKTDGGSADKLTGTL